VLSVAQGSSEKLIGFSKKGGRVTGLAQAVKSRKSSISNQLKELKRLAGRRERDSLFKQGFWEISVFVIM
jgi:hypothetical protein